MGELAGWRGATRPGGVQGLWAPAIGTSFQLRRGKQQLPSPAFKVKGRAIAPHPGSLLWVGRGGGSPGFRWGGERRCVGMGRSTALALGTCWHGTPARPRSAQPRFSVRPWASSVGARQRVWGLL